MIKKLNIGLIGMGNISRIHLHAYELRKDVRIKAIADRDQGLLLRKAKEIGVTEAYPDYTVMLKDPDIDVIDIMTPHYLHAQCVRDALQAGKTVICEKPLATTIRDINAIAAVSRRTGHQVYVKEYYRYSLVNQKALNMIQDGHIGKPYFAQCVFTGDSRKEYLNPGTWRGSIVQSGGGVFMDIGVHVFDWLHLLFGKPQAVYSQHRKITSMLPEKGEDFATVIAEFPDNMLVNVTTTHTDIGYRFRWEVRIYGTKGVMTIIDTGKIKKTLQIVKENKVTYEYSEAEWWRQANIRALHEIIDHIKKQEPPTLLYPHVSSVMKTVFAVYQSARTGKSVRLTV